MGLVEHILSLVAPHYCLGCAKEGPLLCGACCGALPAVPPRCYRCGAAADAFRTCKSCRRHSALFQVWCATMHDGAAKTLVHRLKFERARTAADIAAHVMAIQLPARSDWLVTHAPTAPQRVRERGYDQAQLMARRLARLAGCEYASLLLRVSQHRQVGQTRKVRREQMAQAFWTVRTQQISGRHILLVDDVLTTGSTLEAAAATLKAAGAKRVSAAVFAAA
jgi:ComF family protein